MNHVYPTEVGFMHAVLYRDKMIEAWCRRTGRMSKRGSYGYKPEECPHDIPTNDERGLAEAIRFRLQPLKHGQNYLAYLAAPKPEHAAAVYKLTGVAASRGAITTWNGELLAVVTRITSYNAVCFGRDAGVKGSFWAIGIDGRTYYGRHNGRCMYCRMRLAKWQDEYDIEQQTCAGWEIVSSERTRESARASVKEYRDNQPELAVRIKRRKVRQA